MSKLILNVSHRTYTTEEVKKLLEREQELRESLKVTPFAENFEVVELFTDSLEDWEDYELGQKPEHTIPWDLSEYLIKVFFAKDDNYLQVTKELREEFTNLCRGKSTSYVTGKLFEGDLLVIQDDLLRYPNNRVSSINEFIAYGAATNKEYLINQYFEVLD